MQRKLHSALITNMPKITVIIVAGGRGTRMQSSVPKQFLLLKEKAIARYSFDIFRTIPDVFEIVVVCDPEYRHLFHSCKFADSGKERQDSVWNGLEQISPLADFVAVHDSARPFITRDLVLELIAQASSHSAVASAVRVKATIKQADPDGTVIQTLDRSNLWEMHTPQITTPSLLREGLSFARSKNLTVTDDAAAVELIGHKVKLIPGSYQNIKITTPEDLAMAQSFVL